MYCISIFNEKTFIIVENINGFERRENADLEDY